MTVPEGVLVVNKPPGMTSHDVVHRVRKTLALKKVGHAGTLDPDATGVLVLCVGDATRVLEYATASSKEYETQVVFGTATDTDDATGEVIETASANALTEVLLKQTLLQFQGEIDQQVPAYSAVHINGRRAYELARAGESFELPTRRVQIHRLQLQSFTQGAVAKARLRVACSKGTYIRSLCRDLGRALHIPAHMGALKRTQSGKFRIEEAVDLEEWEHSAEPAAFLRPMLEAVSLLHVEADEARVNRLALGQRVLIAVPDGVQEHSVGEQVAVVRNGRLAAICEINSVAERQWLVQPKKVFWKKG